MSGNFSLGKAEGELALKYTGHPAAEAAERDLNNVTRSAERGAGPALDKVGNVALVAGASIVAGLGMAVKSAASFEKTISAVGAVSGATEEQLEQVRKKALQLGKDTKFSAAEAAQAIEELSKAGVSLPDIMNGAADATVALAAAGEIALPRAAEIASNAMNTFSLKAQDLPKVADLISGAANASAIDVEEFAQSLQQSGAAAALAGVPFEDLTTAIALLGNAGIKGSDAGTSLKTMLLNLQPETKKQSTLMKELGIITKDGSNQFFDAQGKAKGLGEIAGVLSKALKGQTEQQKLATLSTLFGSDAIRAAAILTKQGAEGFDKMSASIGKVKAADVAAKRMDNFSGSMEALKGSLETAGIQLGMVLLPTLRGIVDGLNEVVGAFLALDPATQKNIVSFAQVAAAMLITFGVLLKLITIVRSVAIGFQLLWASALGPIALVIAALVAIGVAVFLLYKKFEPVRRVVDQVIAALQEKFQQLLPYLIRAGQIAQQVGEALRTAFIKALPTLQAIFRVIVNDIIPAILGWYKFLFTTFAPLFVKLAGIIREFVMNVITYFKQIQPQLTAIFNVIKAIVEKVLPPILVIVKFVFGQAFDFVMSTLRLLAAGISILLSGIANIFRGVFNIIGGIIKVFLSLITGQWGQAWAGIVQIFRGVWQLILGIIQSILGVIIIGIVISTVKAIQAIFSAGWAIIRGIFTGAANAIRAVVGGLAGAIRSVISSAMNFVLAVFRGQWRLAMSIVQGAVRSILGFIRGLASLPGTVAGYFSRMLTAIVQWITRALEFIKGFPGRVVSAMGDTGKLLYAAGQKIVQGLINGIKSMAGAVASAASDIASKVGGFFPGSPVKVGPLKTLNRGHAGKEIIRMVISGLQSQQSDLENAIRSVAAPVPNLLLGTSTGLVESAARTPNLGDLTGVTAAFPAGLEEALGSAVSKGMAGAEIVVGADGLARLVFKQISPALVKGVRR